MENRGMWGAAMFPIRNSEVFGGMWDSDPLHWTRAEAVAEIEDHVVKVGLLPMEWTSGEGDLMIGRTHGNDKQRYAVLVRSARLPKREPPVP
jgi:hypothetical protein